MGGMSQNALRHIFCAVKMPATMEKLEKDDPLGSGNTGMVYREVHTAIGYGLVHQKGNRFWLDEKVLQEGIEHAKKEIEEWQKYMNHLEARLGEARTLASTKK